MIRSRPKADWFYRFMAGYPFMVLRRTPVTVTGLCLLLWSVLNLGQSLPASSPLFMLNSAFKTGWVGLWLLALCFMRSSELQQVVGDTMKPERVDIWLNTSKNT